jgi:hypothetical protein
MIDGINALCWERKLPGNFQEVVSLLEVVEGIMPLDEEHLRVGWPRISCWMIWADFSPWAWLRN